MTLKNIGLYILLSALVVLFLTQVHWFFSIFLFVYHGIEKQMSSLFADSVIGRFLGQWFALMAVPAIIALTYLIIYWLIKRQFNSFFFVIMWFIWILLVALLR